MLVGILVTSSTTTYGLTNRHVPMYLFKPVDPALIPRRVAYKNADLMNNHWVLVQATDEVGRLPRGELVKDLGPCGDWEVERNALVYAYQIATWGKTLPDLLIPEPRALFEAPFVNIDPPGCRDIDDAVAIVGNRIAIAIADVAAWVQLNPWLIGPASAMGQTMYVDGKPVRPMLPPLLSDDKASLLPGQRRPAVVLTFLWENGAVTDMDILRCDIVNRQACTYSEAEHLSIAPQLEDFTYYVLGEDSRDPHKWVEALMVFYNKCVAFLLAEKGAGLLRTQTAPDTAKLTKYTQVCPEAIHLASNAAVYAPATEPTPHFAFDDLYTHATSPLRRWADVFNQCAVFDLPMDCDIDLLNARDKQLKKFNRDLAFLEALQYPVQPLGGVVLENKEDHCRIFVTAWKRVVSVPRTDLAVGERVRLKYHLNMEHLSWKRRLVMEVC